MTQIRRIADVVMWEHSLPPVATVRIARGNYQHPCISTVTLGEMARMDNEKLSARLKRECTRGETPSPSTSPSQVSELISHRHSGRYGDALRCRQARRPLGQFVPCRMLQRPGLAIRLVRSPDGRC